MNEAARKALRRTLKRRGFDLTKSYKSGSVHPQCSQCRALVICGLACHEQSCPNMKRSKEKERAW